MSRTPMVLGQIDKILASIEGSHNKSAEAHTEAGSIGGETTHPVKNVDDNTTKATEGFRSKENESDVKETVGKPGVNSASEVTTGGQDSVQLNIGVNAGETGKDVPSAKGGKQDGGTYDGKSTHPARTDNDSLEGGKYASVKEATAVLRGRIKQAQVLGNEIMGAMAVSATKPTAPAHKQAAVPVAEEAQVGYDFAGTVSQDFDKQAFHEAVVTGLAETVLIGETQAEKVAEYLDEFFAYAKTAGDEEGDMGESSGGDGDGDESSALPYGDAGGLPGMDGGDAGGGDPMGAGGPPPGAGGDPGAGGGNPLQGIDPQVLQQLLHLLLAQQGGGAGGAGGAGGGDPSAMLQGGQSMGGGDAMSGMAAPADAGAGGPPPGADAGGGGMPPPDGDQMGMLHQAMLMAGTNPDAVEAAAAQKLAGSLKAQLAKTGGKAPAWRPKNAAQQQQVAAMAGYLQELTGRR